MEKAMIRSKNWKEWREEDAFFEIDDSPSQKITEDPEFKKPQHSSPPISPNTHQIKLSENLYSYSLGL